MAKILLLAVAIWLLIIVLKRYIHNMQPPARPPSSAETMVQCAYCGLHLPESDSLRVNHQHYCCEAHSKQTQP
jgi:uncharacterized protein